MRVRACTPPAWMADLAGPHDFADCFASKGRADLRAFLACFFSYRPGWQRALFSLRRGLARVMGLKQAPQAERAYAPSEVSFTPGDATWLFKVGRCRECAENGGGPVAGWSYWSGEARDGHLRAVLAVAVERLPNGAYRHLTATYVQYLDWRGPLYFALVKPFHALVVRSRAFVAAQAGPDGA